VRKQFFGIRQHVLEATFQPATALTARPQVVGLPTSDIHLHDGERAFSAVFGRAGIELETNTKIRNRYHDEITDQDVDAASKLATSAPNARTSTAPIEDGDHAVVALEPVGSKGQRQTGRDGLPHRGRRPVPGQ
jgi:hypothetical protein